MKDLDFRGKLAKNLLERFSIKPHGQIVTEQLMIGSLLSD